MLPTSATVYFDSSFGLFFCSGCYCGWLCMASLVACTQALLVPPPTRTSTSNRFHRILCRFIGRLVFWLALFRTHTLAYPAVKAPHRYVCTRRRRQTKTPYGFDPGSLLSLTLAFVLYANHSRGVRPSAGFGTHLACHLSARTWSLEKLSKEGVISGRVWINDSCLLRIYARYCSLSTLSIVAHRIPFGPTLASNEIAV